MRPDLEPAKPSNLSRESVEEIAEAVARQVGYRPGAPLKPVVAALGGELYIRDYFETEETGSIEIHGPADFQVFVPTHTSALRDRFTVAHELGHYVLHYLLPKHKGVEVAPTFASRYGRDRAEQEANWFASAFLMPEADIRQYWGAGACSVADIAGHFAVSTSAAAQRLKRLVGDLQNSEWHETLAKNLKTD